MDKTLEVILALVMIGATLDFGGVQPHAYSLLEGIIFFCLFLLLLKQRRQGKIDLRVPYGPVLFALLAVLQMIPLPSGLIRSLSPARLPGPSGAGLSQGKVAWASFSIYSHDTALVWIKFLAFFAAFLLAVSLFDSRKGKSIVLRGLVFLGFFEAAYGILQYLTGSNKIFTYTNPFAAGEATGTYINRNHFAGLLELAVPFAAASSFYGFETRSRSLPRGPGRHTRAGGQSVSFQFIFYAFLAVIMVVAVLLSHSRMGIIAIVSSILFIGVLGQVRSRRKVWSLAVLFFLTCVMGYGLWIGLDPVLARFEQMTQPDFLRLEGRISLWKDEVRMVRDHPLVGTGLGTFGIGFRRYQTTFADLHVDHAHNDYLEIAAESGVPGAALLFLPIFYLFCRMILSFLDDPSRYRRCVTLGCIGSSWALLIHSLTDFNLQIPANALIFSVVLGVGYKAACIERGGRNQTAAPFSS